MTSQTFLIGIVATILSASLLFHVSYKVEQIRHDIRHMERTVQEERAAIRTLEAEWHYLNTPARIEDLVQTHLPHLQPTALNRVVTPEAFTTRLAMLDTPSQTPLPDTAPQAVPHLAQAAPHDDAPVALVAVPLPQHKPYGLRPVRLVSAYAGSGWAQ